MKPLPKISQSYRNVQEDKMFLENSTFEDDTTLPETSGSEYPWTQRHVTEETNSQLQCYVYLKIAKRIRNSWYVILASLNYEYKFLYNKSI
jgi:hypothetical protein